jgi:Tfp pilus assembly protein FimT
MNNAGATTELIYVLATMAVLLVFAVAAVIIFIRLWRSERKK